MFQFPKDLQSHVSSVQSLRKEVLALHVKADSINKYSTVLQTTHCLEVVLVGHRNITSSVDKRIITKGDVQFRKRANYIFETSSDYEGVLFFFENMFITDFLEEHVIIHSKRETKEELPPFTFRVTPFITYNIEEIVSVINSKREYRSCIVKFSLYQILLQILDRNKNNVYVEYLKYLVNNQKINLPYYMEKNFTQALNIETLAKQTGRSLSTFKKEFKEEFKTTPMKWLINRRLKYANYLITKTTRTVSDIAFHCGFENVSHFSKSYKAKFGLSPVNERNTSTI